MNRGKEKWDENIAQKSDQLKSRKLHPSNKKSRDDEENKKTGRSASSRKKNQTNAKKTRKGRKEKSSYVRA